LTRLLNIYGADKLFFHLFQSFFERPSGHTCRVNSPFNGTRQGLASFFLIFLKFFLSGRNPKFTSIDTDFFARESRQLTRITFKIRFNDLTIHDGEAIRVDSYDSSPPSAVYKFVLIPVDRSPRRMKSELALQYPP
jgi:hypothetical protein